MKAYICDVCGAQAQPDTYDLPPTGWYSVNKRTAGYEQNHICGPCCLQTYTTGQTPATEPQPAAPEAALDPCGSGGGYTGPEVRGASVPTLTEATLAAEETDRDC